jgi:hypothetical protein
MRFVTIATRFRRTLHVFGDGLDQHHLCDVGCVQLRIDTLEMEAPESDEITALTATVASL